MIINALFVVYGFLVSFSLFKQECSRMGKKEKRGIHNAFGKIQCFLGHVVSQILKAK